jgi:hypothetical protein
MEKLVACRGTQPESRDTMAFFGAHDKPLQLVLKFKDAYLVRDAIGVVRPSVLANATPNEIFQ